ncbi:MAG TPA: serine protease [Thermoprotei archaeon]|nr:serine protease [Thermoprotei archaeon]
MYRRISSLIIVVLMLLSVLSISSIYSVSAAEDSGDSLLGFKLLLSKHGVTGDALIDIAVVIDGSTPFDEVCSIYNGFKDLKIVVEGKRLSAVFSNIARTRNGDYIFKVRGKANDLLGMLSEYKTYIKSINYRPVFNYKNLLQNVGSNIPGISFKDKKVVPGENTFIVRHIIGADAVEAIYNINGSGVKIAIVDTGVDYGHPDLQNKLVFFTGYYNGTWIREPLVLDADESQVIMLKTFNADVNGYIDVSNENFTIYVPDEVNVSAPYTSYYVGNVTSVSGDYKFGVTYMLLPVYGWMTVGVLMSDPDVSHNYTTLIIDANNNGIFNESVDAFAFYTGNRILAAYYPGDTWPYISFGVAGGFFFDVGWWFSGTSKFYPGWDLNGNYISIFYDFYGHGTSCSSAAAGEGGVPGIAPGAKILGVKSLWWGDIEAGMLWAAGFDVDPVGGLMFYYTGSKRADIISNSWGISTFVYDITGFGYDYISMLENGLSTPYFLDGSFPGILIVHAAGNGGGGYGTVTSPGAASGVLTVGASTSTYVYVMYYGFGDYTYDQIIGWSARGPTPMGEVKPDVVNVGAFGLTAAPVGYDYWIFGGTSYATPLTAGVAALVYQALYQILGPSAMDINPAEVKTIIQDTADPLGYPPMAQGAGRVNALRAVNLTRSLYSIVYTPSQDLMIFNLDTGFNTGEKLNDTWFWYWQDYINFNLMYWYNDMIFPVSSSLPSEWMYKPAYSIYVPDIPQGGSKNFTLFVYNPTNSSVSVKATPVKLMKFMERTRVVKISVSKSNPEGSYVYLVLDKNRIPADTDLLMVSSFLNYKVFDGDDDYLSDYETYVIAYVWINDTNKNGIPDVDERVLVNYDTSSSNVNVLEISDPIKVVEQFGPNAKLLFRIWLCRGFDSTPFREAVVNQKIGVKFEYYKFVNDPTITLNGSHVFSFNLAKDDQAAILGKISVGNIPPTVYLGFIKVSTKIDSVRKEYYVPYSYTVYQELSGSRYILLNKYRGGRKILYSWDRLRGHTDWDWRYESGDWRFYYVGVTDPDTWLIEVNALWSDSYTSLITYTLGPDGQFAGLSSISRHMYLGSGIFVWTDTGSYSRTNLKRVVVFPSTTYRYSSYPTDKPNTGVYTVIIRNGLTGGRYYPEKVKVIVRPIKSPYLLPSGVQLDHGTILIGIIPPYPATAVDAYPMQPSLPMFTSQVYCTYNTTEVVPVSYVKHGSYYLKATYLLNWSDPYCFYGTPDRIDIGVMYYVEMPIATRYYRIGWTYYDLGADYVFEDWVITIGPSYY